MKALLDSNIIISGLLWSGLPRTVLKLAEEQKFSSISSEELLDELRGVLERPKFLKQLAKRNQSASDVVQKFVTISSLVEPVPISDDVVRDPKDKKVLACAVGGQANFIVTGDDDLLVLQKFQEIQIVNAEQFLKILEDKSD